jgi:hypothetical protein
VIDRWVPCLGGRIDDTHRWRDQLRDEQKRYRPKSNRERGLSGVSFPLVRGSYTGVPSHSR